MNWPSKKEIAELREKYPQGTIIKLIKMNDSTPVPPGTIGTVTSIDDVGTIHCRWWNYPSSLGIIPNKDEFEIIQLDDLRKKIFEKIKDKSYEVYFPRSHGKTVEMVLRKAIENERRKLLNCHDGYFDDSPKASFRRIMIDFNKMIKEG